MTEDLRFDEAFEVDFPAPNLEVVSFSAAGPSVVSLSGSTAKPSVVSGSAVGPVGDWRGTGV